MDLDFTMYDDDDNGETVCFDGLDDKLYYYDDYKHFEDEIYLDLFKLAHIPNAYEKLNEICKLVNANPLDDQIIRQQ